MPYKQAFETILITLVLLALLSGCSMLALKKELEYIDQTVLLEGKITDFSPQNKPVIIIVYKVETEGNKLVEYSIYYRQQTYHFILPPGRYFIAAFEDANEDLVYQENEYAGYYGAPDIVDLKPGSNPGSLDLELLKPGISILSEYPDLSSPASRADIALHKPNIGEVVSLDEERFSVENGRMGLWEPVRFLNEGLAGMYFLEPYKAAKIPVLFVHGAGGTPNDWSFIAEQLDRENFQPWFIYYPSGLRLNIAGEVLRRTLAETRLSLVDHLPADFVLISHSMGGLVSRGLVNRQLDIAEQDNDRINLSLFISISTPWRGHEAAPVGVKHSPAVIPSWIDMVPGSEFQETLFSTTWPGHIKNHLLFGYKGGSNRRSGNNDGVVSLASQLYPAAQAAATRMHGFNEDHTGILRSKDVADRINRLLAHRYFTIAHKK